MKSNKNFFLTLLVIFSLICGYNIYWSVNRLSMDAELSAMTPEQRSKWLQDDANNKSYQSAVDNSFSLGLDLQGGMFITMEVGVESVVSGLAQNPQDSTLQRALRMAVQKKASSQDNFVDLFISSLKEINPNARLASFFAGKNKIGYNASDSEVADLLRKETEDAIDRTFKILRLRIDQFGVASPNLQLQPGTGRILIELPGVKDPDRVRRLLRGTARLEFWPTYTAQEASAYLARINEISKRLAGAAPVMAADTAKPAVKPGENADSAKAAATLAEVLGSDSNKAQTDSSIANQQAKLRRENPFFGTFASFNNQVPNSPLIGSVAVVDTAAMNRILENPQVRASLPADMKFLWTAKPEGDGVKSLSLIVIKSNREGKAPLTCDVIADATQDFDQQNGKEPIVTMKMNPEGAQIWKRMTEQYIGKSIAVVLDNLVYTYPTVNSVIPTGSSTISGNFTVDEARDLANILKAGKLPAPARIAGEETVGSSLGADTISKGLMSFVLGFLAVMVFMVAYYRGSGFVAVLALVANLFMLLGVMGAFNVVLTLPGIAGIVLTMAMAVDANVLIYERVREEMDAGRGFRTALETGFSNALSAIVDGNITTFLTGVILFVFGSGPIRGFAVTLMIGIATTLICALVITRLIMEYYANRSDNPTMDFGSHKVSEYFRHMKVPFITNRKRYYVIFGIATVLSIGAIAAFNFKLGVDFLGGRQYVVEFQGQAPIDEVRASLTTAFDGEQPVVKTLGANNQLMVTTGFMAANAEAGEEVQGRLEKGLAQFAGAKVLRSTTVGPAVASDIQTGATYAVVFSLIAIFLYILLRFRNTAMSTGAVIALALNVLFVLGLFALLGQVESLPFSVEMNQDLIAALLTIVGYTINDTVVVFDRIRENMEGHKETAETLPVHYNKALNDTLSRTIITPTTVIITTVVMFFFGGDVLKGFMLALFFGVVVGTLTSILLAAPISLDMLLARFRKGAKTTV